MPIFAWYMLVTALMMSDRLSAADPGLDPAGAGTRLRLAVLRSDARRRSAAVAAPVLAVRPSRGLHHLPARGRRDLHHPAGDGPHAARSATAGSSPAIVALAFLQLRALGAPHVHDRHPAHGAGVLLGRLDAGCGADGGADLRLDRHAVEGPTRAEACRCCTCSASSSIFVIGGLTGVMLAIVPFDWQAHDTALRRRASALCAGRRLRLSDARRRLLLAAAFHRTRAVSTCWAEAAFWLIFLGFNVTFFLMHLAGLLGMRRRIDTYPDEMPAGPRSTCSPRWAASSWPSALPCSRSTSRCMIYLSRRRRRIPGTPARSNGRCQSRRPPTTSPACRTWTAAIRSPTISNCQSVWHGGRAICPNPTRAGAKSLTVEIATGKPDFHIIYPTNTRLPIVMAAVTGVFFVSLLLKFYSTAPLAVAGVTILAWRWAWSLGRKTDLPLRAVGPVWTCPTPPKSDARPAGGARSSC